MSKNIISRLQPAFETALDSGDLSFFLSTVHRHRDLGIQFELRLCPALEHKPKLPAPRFEGKSGNAYDPFAPPYISKLLVGELQDEDGAYVVLLNKYSVVPRHFLLVTKDYQSQSSPLLPPDLLQAYLLLIAAPSHAGSHFFAFFNCGDLSGASQHHKHIQFIPVDEGGPPIERLARSQTLDIPTMPFSLNLPYANYVFRLPSSLPSSPPEDITRTLSQAFVQLLDLVIATVRQSATQPPGPPSYNVVLTLEHLHLIPRSQENYIFSQTGDSVSVNALGYAGMLLVKSDIEMEAVKQEGPGKILRGVGLKPIEVQGEDL